MIRRRWDVNYRVDPELFSNRIIVDLNLIEKIATLLEGSTPMTADGLIALAVLSENVVLNEKLILAWENLCVGPDEMDFLSTSCQDLLSILNDGEAIEVGDRDSAGNAINHELSMLQHPGSDQRVEMVHGSHVFYEWNVDPLNPLGSPSDYLEEVKIKWSKRAQKSFNKRYLEAIKSYGYFHEDATPWNLVANCHGIPYCSDPFYTIRDIDEAAPTNIGYDLFKKLEELHQNYFRKIRKYLGPTFIRLPTMLSIVLKDCKKRDDIQKKLIDTREKFYKFRKKCTELEYDLRTAEKIKDQIKVITEIEDSYNSLVKKISKGKKRIIYRAFDIVKNIDPVKMGLSIIDQAKEYDIEREAIMKIPGYYDLWNASLEIEQAMPLIQRIFGMEATLLLLLTLDELMEKIDSTRQIDFQENR